VPTVWSVIGVKS